MLLKPVCESAWNAVTMAERKTSTATDPQSTCTCSKQVRGMHLEELFALCTNLFVHSYLSFQILETGLLCRDSIEITD